MSKKKLIACTLLALLNVASLEGTPAEQEPSVLIEQTKALQQIVSETLTVYGRVQPAPDAVQTISLPHAGLIVRIDVRLGQRVRRGDNLLTLITAPTAHMEYTQALSAVDYAKRKLARQQQLLEEQLTTNARTDAARRTLADARSNLEALKAQGQNKPNKTLTAPTDGIVTFLGVKQGDRVPADTAALAIASGNRLIAKLGVEPEDIHLLKPGTPVKISSVFVPDYHAQSHLSEIHAMINPKTRLVDALAPIPPAKSGQLVLGSYLTAELQLSAHTGITVPRSAVLQDDHGYYVFIVADNSKAKRINVDTGLESDQWIEITSGLKLGQSVVSVGNYVLTDNMVVREKN